MMRNTPPPLASNDLLGRIPENKGANSPERPIHAESNETNTKEKKQESDDTVLSRVATENARWNNRTLNRMIDPFSETNKETARGNCGGGRQGKQFQDSCAGEQKDNDADDHKNLIPVVKLQFREWIFHWQRHCGPTLML